MIRKILVLLVSTALLIGASEPSFARKGKLPKMKSWIVYYGAKFPDQKIPTYDLYIFDSTNFPTLEPLKSNNSKVVGYLSIGEIAKYDSSFSKIKKEKLLVDQNKNWPDSYRINIKSENWHNFIINEKIPEILAKGFDGVFLDTVDTAQYLETDKKINGSILGAADLIKKMRAKYPEIIIIMNNGLFLTDVIGDQIDALLVEDIFTLYDFKTKTYNLATDEWTQNRLKPALKFKEKFKKPVLPLEYLDKNDEKAIKKVKKEAKKAGLVPYIADIDLQTIFFHP